MDNNSCDTYIGGVDEAGRGPVLGPMIYSLAIVKKSHFNSFSEWWGLYTTYKTKLSYLDYLKNNEIKENNNIDYYKGVENRFKDSKKLTESERKNLFDMLKELNDTTDIFKYKICSISAKEISYKMLKDDKYNLNKIAADSTISVINDLSNKYTIEKIYVDALGPSDKHQSFLNNTFNNISFEVTSKCDTKYSITSATSVCAKYTRDIELQEFKFIELNNYDNNLLKKLSGYPGDPDTIKWLESNFNTIFGYPSIVRFSWSTAMKVIDSKIKYYFKSENENKKKQELLKQQLKDNKSYFEQIKYNYNFDL